MRSSLTFIPFARKCRNIVSSGNVGRKNRVRIRASAHSRSNISRLRANLSHVNPRMELSELFTAGSDRAVKKSSSCSSSMIAIRNDRFVAQSRVASRCLILPHSRRPCSASVLLTGQCLLVNSMVSFGMPARANFKGQYPSALMELSRY